MCKLAGDVKLINSVDMAAYFSESPLSELARGVLVVAALEC